MVQRFADNFARRMNSYVPAMSYAADVNIGNASVFSLGTPAAFSNSNIDASVDADATAGTVETQDSTADALFGRTVVVKPSADPGATGTLYVIGRDYLGQPMKETFVTTSGSSANIYGKKAFKWIDSTVVGVAAANAITYSVGWGYRLGLPYQGMKLEWVRENGVLVPVLPPVITLRAEFSDADATSGGSRFLRTPVPGYISAIRGIPHGTGSTNDPVITIELGGTVVTGLTVTVDTSDATGAIVSDVPTTAGYNSNNRLSAGDVIEVVAAAAASAGPITVEVDVTSTQFLQADITDPATISTGDPRGTFEGVATYDGSKEFVVGLVATDYVNSSGNGGLHGIRHYFA